MALEPTASGLTDEEETMRYVRSMILGVAATIGIAAATSAAAYPERPITMMVPWPVGGIVDLIARDMARGMSERLGQPIVIENRPGAGGNLGSQIVAQAPPNGYMIVMGTATTHAINQSLYKNMRYHALKDFEPIVLVASQPLMLVVNSKVKAQNVRELIDLAKAQPGKLTYASAGNGSTTHLAGEQFKAATGTDILHVPYDGGPQALLDTVAGRADIMFFNQSLVQSHIDSGSLRVLGITGKTRVSSAPNVPTLHEAGVKDFENLAWFGLLAPKGTPREIVDKLNDAARKTIAEPGFVERRVKTGAMPGGGTPDEFRAFIESELVKWAAAVKAAGATVD
jgi:tripartite-type tricarboxylate transporter receptor subunit TctC